MEITHTWKIKTLERLNDGSGIVCHVRFNIQSNYQDITIQSIYRDIDLETENISNFIEYDNLTEEIVVSWIKNKIGSYCTELELENEKIIELNINPPAPLKITELPPWEQK